MSIDRDIGLRNLDISLGLSEVGGALLPGREPARLCLSKATRHPASPDLQF